MWWPLSSFWLSSPQHLFYLEGTHLWCESGRICVPLRNWRDQILLSVPWRLGCWHMTKAQPAVCSCLGLWLLRKWHRDPEAGEKLFTVEVAMSRAQWQSHHGKPSITFGGCVSWAGGAVMVRSSGSRVLATMFSLPTLPCAFQFSETWYPYNFFAQMSWWILIQLRISNN